MTKTVALIPARSGSKRIPDKNIRDLDGHPLLAYSISAAMDSGVFSSIICVTDSDAYADIARYYGAEVPAIRPENISGDKSPDIEWVQWILALLGTSGCNFDAFSILRPTSPFRTSETIRRAYRQFLSAEAIDSLRAVELCRQHPGKMWVVRNNSMDPLMPVWLDVPWHSSQYAALPRVYVQNASLEIAWTKVVYDSNTISGSRLIPFFTEEFEGLDVNEEFDWWRAEFLLKQSSAKLAEIRTPSWFKVKGNNHG